MSLLSALETEKPAPSARVPRSQGWAPDPAPTPLLDPRLFLSMLAKITYLNVVLL